MTTDLYKIMPEGVKTVISRLKSSGFSAYAVGGAVRDSVMGLTPCDWDIATNAKPCETEAVFSDLPVIKTGEKHGTVTVICGEPCEVTTFRTEGEYLDKRRPSKVEFVADLEGDLSRRDFTINALAYDENEGIIDLYGGLDDIKRKIIRTVGDPYKRFDEDALRILRAVRFSSKTGFEIENNTYAAAALLRENLGSVSKERIFAELEKTLLGENVTNTLLNCKEIITEVIPELKNCVGFNQNNPWHRYDVYEHIARAVGYVQGGSALKFAMLLHDVGKPCVYTEKDGVGHFYGHAKVSSEIAEKVFARLKFPKKLSEKALFLIENHDKPLDGDKREIKRTLYKIGEENFADLMKIKYADNAAYGSENAKEAKKNLEATERAFLDVVNSGECYDLKSLAIKGGDLTALGIAGENVKKELERLLFLCIDRPELNVKQKLIDMAKSRL